MKNRQIAELERAPARCAQLMGAATVEAGAPDGGGSTVPKFSMLAYNGGPVDLAGWPYPVVVDVAGLKVNASTPIRRNHSKDRVVGHVTDLAIDKSRGEIRAAGVLSIPNADQREIAQAAANGFPWQASVGVRADNVESVRAGATAHVNGRTINGPAEIIRRGALMEISILDLGADGNTRVTVAAESDAERPEMALAESPETETPAGAEFSDDVQAELERHKAEARRRAEIGALTRRFLGDVGLSADDVERISRQALAENWTPTQAELTFLRRSRGAPAVHVRRGNGASTMALCAAALLGLGIPSEFIAKQKEFDERTLEAADKFHGVTLHGLIGYALEAVGVRCPAGGPAVWDAYSANHRKLAEAGTAAGVNMPTLIGTAGAKILLASFLEIPVAFREVCQLRELSSFLKHNVYRMDHRGSWQKVGTNGELAKGALEESGATNQLDTYGQIIMLDRKNIVNDDLGAFAQLLQSMGRQAAIAAEYAVFDAFMESSDSFFNAGVNKLTGAFSLASVGAAEALLFGQKDVNGMPIYAVPDRIIVPPSLKAAADQLYTSSTMSADATSTGAQRGVDNPYKGRLRPITSPMLELAALAGNSATTWYMSANPNIVPAVQFATLTGKPEPTLENKEADVGRLGMAVQGYWDFSVALIDGRGMIKNV